MRRRLLSFIALSALVLGATSAALAAQEGGGGAIVVADTRGPLDQRALDFIADTIETADAQVVVVQLDSPGLSSGDRTRLDALLAADAVPLALWVGPSGAVGFGEVARELARAADVVGAAPGAEIGYFSDEDDGGACDWSPQGPCPDDEAVPISATGENPARFTEITPTIGLFLAAMDGVTVSTAAGDVVLETAETVAGENGLEVTVPSVEVRFLKPGLLTRALRLASRPEAAFFFLLVGIAAAAFEFYAAGVGVTAAVAVLALFLAGYGIATLPMSWVSLGAVLVGMLFWTSDFQRNQMRILSLLGAVFLVWGGLTFTDTSPQYPPRWWAVVLAVIVIGLFYVYALTTVVRSRFSTRTIGREHLVGKRGTAETTFDPEGTVVLDGARWRARSPRAAGLEPGDDIEVLEVKGIVLEVGPVPQP